MKKIIALFLTVLSLVLISPPAYNVEAATIKLNTKKVTLIKGQTKQLKVTGTKKKIKWTSNKKAVATVTSKGKVTAKKVGTAKITAKVDNKKYVCTVTVENPQISKTKATIKKGKTIQLKITGTSQPISWTSSNISVAKVSQKGKVTALKTGKATITAKVCNKKYKCIVTVTSDTINIVDMKMRESSECVAEDRIVDSYGNIRNNVFRVNASVNAFAEYDLSGKYKKFTGGIVAGENTGSGVDIEVGIFVDGVLKYSTRITKETPKQEFSINVEKAKKLSIRSCNHGAFPYGYVYFVNSKFLKNSTAQKTEKYNKISDIYVIDSMHYEKHDNKLTIDSFGNLHDGGIRFDASNNAYATYNLNSKYDLFNVNITAGNDTGSGAVIGIEIYLDGILKYECNNITKNTSVIPIQLDVDGVNVMKVVTYNTGAYPYGYLYFVDDYLY